MKIMSRKSERLQVKKTDELQIIKKQAREIRILRRKRKEREWEEEVETTGMSEDSPKSHHFQVQNQYIPVTSSSGFTRSALVALPNAQPLALSTGLFEYSQNFRFRNIFPCPLRDRISPLPRFSWADSLEVWKNMLKKEGHYVRNSKCLDRHPLLEPKMRSILLDWLLEVCEVYKLHRETYYLAVDFIDRYLAESRDIPKTRLQLVGITALFVAAKLEEIYPPKLPEFAYVTDGACSEQQILDQEIEMLKALNWDLSPVTVNTWLNLYMQLTNVEEILEQEQNFIYPKYSPHSFIKIARLLDLCVLDIGSWQFSYSTIAASAFYHMTSSHLAFQVTGFQLADIALCLQWMDPFKSILQETDEVVELKQFKNVFPEDSHNIQTHNSNLSLLDKVKEKFEALNVSCRYSPVPMAGMLTPPHSSKKTKQQIEVIEVV